MRARLFHPVEQRAKLVRLVGPLPPQQNALSYREFPLLPKHLPHVYQDRAQHYGGGAQPPRGPKAKVSEFSRASSAPPQAFGSPEEAHSTGGAASFENLVCVA